MTSGLTSSRSTYHNVSVNFTGPTSSGSAGVHYISAGAPTLPTILLLHGFPSSSHQFRNFIPLLSDRYHILAPDLPGFGLTAVPTDFDYTFDNLAAVIAAWLEEIEVRAFAMYIFDYGAPVGLRLALRNPERVRAVVSQNGNAYTQGFGQDFWAPIFALWNSSNSPANREMLRQNVLTLETTKYQYTSGTPLSDLPLLDPEAWNLDYLQNLQGKENQERQLDLFYDYRKNVEFYPVFQKYFRESRVPVLAVWGRGDPAFVPAGAEAFRGEETGAVVRFVEGGHFALETRGREVAGVVGEWLAGIGYGKV